MRVLPAKQVISKTGLSRTSIWRQEREGKFPCRIQISPNRVGWLEDEVDEWIESRPRSGQESDGAGSSPANKAGSSSDDSTPGPRRPATHPTNTRSSDDALRSIDDVLGEERRGVAAAREGTP